MGEWRVVHNKFFSHFDGKNFCLVMESAYPFGTDCGANLEPTLIPDLVVDGDEFNLSSSSTAPINIPSRKFKLKISDLKISSQNI